MANEQSDGLEVKEVQVGSEIVDRRGRRWATPGDSLENKASVHRRSALDMKCVGEDAELFEIRWKRSDELQDSYAKGYIHADQEDIGATDGVTVTGPNGEAIEKAEKVYGSSEGKYLRVGDLWGMKIPKVLAQRLDEEEKKAAKMAVRSVGPDEKMLRQMKEAGVKFQADGTPVHVDEPLPRGDLGAVTKYGMEE